MNNKVLFVDGTKMANSVAKILARNIMMMDEDERNIQVINLEDLEFFKFTNETLVLVDPMIYLDNFFLKRYIPKRIKVMNFKLGAYSSLEYYGILEQINHPEKTSHNNLLSIFSFKKKNSLK